MIKIAVSFIRDIMDFDTGGQFGPATYEDYQDSYCDKYISVAGESAGFRRFDFLEKSRFGLLEYRRY